jgi:spermidine synthase
MTPWTSIERTQTPDGTRLELLSRGEHFSIRVNGQLLMNSRVHDSEETLAELALGALTTQREAAQVLVGGLGFGYTLAAALARLGPAASVCVSEISPAIIAWNRDLLAHLNGRALDDPRVVVLEGDVCDVFRSPQRSFDAILLDVDNGPRAVGRPSNGWLYSPPGLAAIRGALNPGGVLAIWSAGPEVSFSERLRQAQFSVVLQRVRSHRARTQERHFIWLATNA